MRDPLDTLRDICDVPGSTVRDLSEQQGRSVDEVLLDLDRYRHERLVEVDTSPHGTVFYYLTVAGVGALWRSEESSAAERLDVGNV